MPDSSIRPVLAPPVSRMLLRRAGESLPAGGWLPSVRAAASLALSCLLPALPCSLSLRLLEGTVLAAPCGCRPSLSSAVDRMGPPVQGCLLAQSPARGLLGGVSAICELLRWSILCAPSPTAGQAVCGNCLRLLLRLLASL